MSSPQVMVSEAGISLLNELLTYLEGPLTEQVNGFKSKAAAIEGNMTGPIADAINEGVGTFARTSTQNIAAVQEALTALHQIAQGVMDTANQARNVHIS